MPSEIWKMVNKGDSVRIYSSELSDPMKIDSRVFTVESVIRSIVELLDSNGKKHKVHKNRLSEILKKEEVMNTNPTPEKKDEPVPTVVQPQPCACTPPADGPCTCPCTPEVKEPEVTKPVKAAKPKPVKVAKAKDAKAKPVKADLKGMVAAGWEIWSKPVEFNNKAGADMGIKVEAHYMVMPGGKESRIVNTYNGCFPVANPDGVGYKVEDLEKKREQLRVKGYKRRK